MQYVLITGATSGIGLELTKLFAADKHHLFLVARRQDELENLARSLRQEYSIEVSVMSVDLSESGAAEKIYQDTKKKKLEIEILVNNAGFGLLGKFSETDWEREASMLQLNVVTLTELTKKFLPEMVTRRSGRILNLASVAAFFPGPYMAVYYASKAYVLSFSLALSEELRGSGITVTALCPGATETNFAQVAQAQKSPLFRGTLATPKSVALAGYNALLAGKSLVFSDHQNALTILLSRLAPLELQARAIALMQRSRR